MQCTELIPLIMGKIHLSPVLDQDGNTVRHDLDDCHTAEVVATILELFAHTKEARTALFELIGFVETIEIGFRPLATGGNYLRDNDGGQMHEVALKLPFLRSILAILESTERRLAKIKRPSALDVVA
jgi:hypothetical protein